MAFDERESAAHFIESVDVDAGDRIETGGQYDNRASRLRDVRLFCEDLDEFGGQSGAAETHQRTAGRPEEYVRAHSGVTLFRLIHEAVAHPDQRQDHRYRPGDQ